MCTQWLSFFFRLFVYWSNLDVHQSMAKWSSAFEETFFLNQQGQNEMISFLVRRLATFEMEKNT
jgi:hypothetical protein